LVPKIHDDRDEHAIVGGVRDSEVKVTISLAGFAQAHPTSLPFGDHDAYGVQIFGGRVSRGLSGDFTLYDPVGSQELERPRCPGGGANAAAEHLACIERNRAEKNGFAGRAQTTEA
jgi:hypothetical protein